VLFVDGPITNKKMRDRQRIEQYITNRRKPISAKEIAEHFLCSVSLAYKICNDLLDRRLVVVTHKNRTRLFKGKH